MTEPLGDARRNFLWTDALDATAIKMARDGHSRSQIAEHFGITRNAVCGRLGRLSVRGIEMTLKDAALAKAKPKRGPTARPRIERRAAPKPFVPISPAVVESVTFDLPTDTAVRLADVRLFDCRWPLGDPRTHEFRFCGADAHSGPYCPYHRGLAYRRAA